MIFKMKEYNKGLAIKFIIGILTLVCMVTLGLIYSDQKQKEEQTLIVEKKNIKVRLLEIKNPPPDVYVKLQDVDSNEIFDDVFVSKICPQYTENEPGKIMTVEKQLLYQPELDKKSYHFKGLYEYICANKKDNKSDQSIDNNAVKSTS